MAELQRKKNDINGFKENSSGCNNDNDGLKGNNKEKKGGLMSIFNQSKGCRILNSSLGLNFIQEHLRCKYMYSSFTIISFQSLGFMPFNLGLHSSINLKLFSSHDVEVVFLRILLRLALSSHNFWQTKFSISSCWSRTHSLVLLLHYLGVLCRFVGFFPRIYKDKGKGPCPTLHFFLSIEVKTTPLMFWFIGM